MPSCCATLHVTVRSCFEDEPLSGSTVTVTKPGAAPGDDPIVVGSAVTDDTGTVTILVGDEGPYHLRATYFDGVADMDVEVVCGINNVEINFGVTDKICFELNIGEGTVDPFDMIVSSGGTEVGRCSIGAVARCCVTIPGPGSYPITSTRPIVSYDPETVEVVETDCGEKVVTVTAPTEGPTCDRHVNVNLCGCPAEGVTVEVSITGVGTYSGVTDANGDATLTMTEPACDAWIGATYTILGTGVSGTITAEPMNVVATTATGRWCLPGADPCFETVPINLNAGFVGGWVGQLVLGTTVILEKTGEYTWESGCFPFSPAAGMVAGANARLFMTINPSVVGCEHGFTGTMVLRWFPLFSPSTLCVGSFNTITLGLVDDTASACPVYFFFQDADGNQIEVTS